MILYCFVAVQNDCYLLKFFGLLSLCFQIGQNADPKVLCLSDDEEENLEDVPNAFSNVDPQVLCLSDDEEENLENVPNAFSILMSKSKEKLSLSNPSSSGVFSVHAKRKHRSSKYVLKLKKRGEKRGDLTL